MKKLFIIFFCAIMCVTLLASCDFLKHEHIPGEWQHDEYCHWRNIDCTWDRCDFDIAEEAHIDENTDGICDVCGRKEEFLFRLNPEGTGYTLDNVGPIYLGGDVIIPSKYRGLPVLEIGMYAFVHDTYKLTSVVIPDSVTTIGFKAFANQDRLTSVKIGNGVVTIESEAFADCDNLKAVEMGDATEYIYAGAFENCTSLETVILGNNVKEITGYVFRGCTSLETITIPASIEKIGAWCFENSALVSIYFGVFAPGENWHEEWADGLENTFIHWKAEE